MPTVLAGVLLTHACTIRQGHGEWEYALWAIGHGHLTHARPPLPRA